MRKREKRKIQQLLIGLVFLVIITIIGYFNPSVQKYIDVFLEIGKETSSSIKSEENMATATGSFDLNSIPKYEKTPYVYINNNNPDFSESDYTTKPFEKYSELDSLGRCGVAYANICKEIMPEGNEKRGSISNIYPSGWKSVKYEGVVEGDCKWSKNGSIFC